MNEDDLLVPTILTSEMIEKMIYVVRGEKVMLDFELAKIYGYETKMFNRQVKNNINKFPKRYRFQLTKDEVEILQRSQNVTSLNWATNKGGRGYLPYAFTEQGIYMLMTVLKGEVATKQSIALIDTFKQMKDYIIENNNLLTNTNSYIESKFSSIDRRFESIEEKMEVVMDNFINPETYKHFAILNGEKFEADIAFQDIYKKAKKSIIVIDDYVDIKTLQLLKASIDNIQITIISDNLAKNNLNMNYIKDSRLNITFIRNDKIFHDRYIIIDYKETSEEIYHCGSSSKDTGSRVTAINRVYDGYVYYKPIEAALKNSKYIFK